MDKKSINKKFVLKILDVTFDQVTITQFFHKNLLVFRCLTNALGVVIKKKPMPLKHWLTFSLIY